MCLYSHLFRINCISRSHVLLYSTESSTGIPFTYEDSLHLKIKLINARRLQLKWNFEHTGIDLLDDSRTHEESDLKEEVSWISTEVYSIGTIPNPAPYPFNKGRVSSTEAEKNKRSPKNKRVESAKKDLWDSRTKLDEINSSLDQMLDSWDWKGLEGSDSMIQVALRQKLRAAENSNFLCDENELSNLRKEVEQIHECALKMGEAGIRYEKAVNTFYSVAWAETSNTC